MTTLYGLSPNYGWTGDTVTASGYYLDGAAVSVTSPSPGVTIAGNATISADSLYSLTFQLPTITSILAGPASLVIRIHTGNGDATGTMTISPSMHVEANADFNHANDGRAWASFDVNRSSGSVTGSATVTNAQMWLSLSVNISAVWLDANQRVVGFTEPQNVSVPGAYTLIGQPWRTDDTVTTALAATTIGPNAGAGPWIHAGRVIILRDHDQELIDTLTQAFASAQTIDFVISKLSPLFA